MIAAELKYKKTRIDWMPEVPEHWEIVRLKNVAKIVSGATPKSSVSANWDGNINWVTPAEFGDEMYIGESVRKITKTGLQSCAASLVPVGSIILSNRAPIGSLGISKVELSTNQGCKSIIPTHINNYFLYFLMTLQKENLNVLGNGTTFRELATPSLRNYKIPFPPREEQDKIASHLYNENEKITHFIQTKQRFIELLKEQRQSIITNAVTKGINEKAKMKETVLGEIPEHWKHTAIKRLVKTKITDGPHETPKMTNEGIPFVSAEAAVNGRIELSKMRCYISPKLHQEYCKKVKPMNGDIFMVKSGSTTGKVVIVDFDDEFSVWSPLALVRPIDSINNEFLFYAMSSNYFQREVQLNWSFGTQPNIGMAKMEQLNVAFPTTIEEQKRIVEHIKSETRTLDIAISKAEREIELIKEYREAMIAEAVTGKMKL
jgi:type I restriction enzyme S subunit